MARLPGLRRCVAVAVIYLPDIVKEITKLAGPLCSPGFSIQKMTTPHEPHDNSGDGLGYSPVSPGAPAMPADPSAKSLVGKLFIVPALVVCLMLGAAVVVVMFGASSMDKPATVDELFAAIERDSGQRQAGMLLPSAKESWQAAQELAYRFERRDEAFFKTEEDINNAALRMIALLRAPALRPRTDIDDAEAQQGRVRLHFMMIALARLHSPLAVEPMIEFLGNEHPTTRRVALQCLAEMGAMPEARSALSNVYRALDDRDVSVRMVACLTVASIARPGDATAIREVSRLLDGDREVQWNAAAALARMGSDRGRLVLMNMLDRDFWRDLELDYEEQGVRVVRRLTDVEVSGRLCAALSSAQYLSDAELRSMIKKLRDADASIEVREAARRALDRQVESGASARRLDGSSSAVKFAMGEVG